MLTPREMQICDLLDLTRREIGQILGISPRTVQAHLKSIFDKLGANSRVEVESRWRGLTSSQAAAVVEIAPRPSRSLRPATDFSKAA